MWSSQYYIGAMRPRPAEGAELRPLFFNVYLRIPSSIKDVVRHVSRFRIKVLEKRSKGLEKALKQLETIVFFCCFSLCFDGFSLVFVPFCEDGRDADQREVLFVRIGDEPPG